MKKKPENENFKKPCRVPATHCTSFYEHLWAAQRKSLKVHE